MPETWTLHQLPHETLALHVCEIISSEQPQLHSNNQLSERQNMTLLCHHQLSTKKIVKCNVVTKQAIYRISFAKPFFSIVGCNFDIIHPIATIAVIVFIMEIGYKLNNVNQIAVRFDIHNIIRYNCDPMGRITGGSYVCAVLNEIAFVIAIDMLIKMLSLSWISHTLSLIFDENILLLYKPRTIECVYGNSSKVTIIMNNFHEISDTAIEVGIFLSVWHFVLQLIDGSPPSIILSTKFDASIAAFSQLMLNSTAQLLISASYCCKSDR